MRWRRDRRVEGGLDGIGHVYPLLWTGPHLLEMHSRGEATSCMSNRTAPEGKARSECYNAGTYSAKSNIK